MPFILIHHMMKEQHEQLLSITTIMFVLMSSYGFDTFHVHGGYCFLWFIYLYFIAAYIRLYKIETIFRPAVLKLLYVVPVILTFVLTLCMYEVKAAKVIRHLSLRKLFSEPSVIGILALAILAGAYFLHRILKYNKSIIRSTRILAILAMLLVSFGFEMKKYLLAPRLGVDSVFYNWNSPFVLVSSIAFFLLFLNCHVKNEKLILLIQTLSPLTFGIYLIHMHSAIPQVLWKQWLQAPAFYHSPWFVLHYIGSVIFVFLVSGAIEWGRQRGMKG